MVEGVDFRELMHHFCKKVGEADVPVKNFQKDGDKLTGECMYCGEKITESAEQLLKK